MYCFKICCKIQWNVYLAESTLTEEYDCMRTSLVSTLLVIQTCSICSTPQSNVEHHQYHSHYSIKSLFNHRRMVWTSLKDFRYCFFSWILILDMSLCDLQGHKSWVLCIAWSPDAKSVASGDEKGGIHLWDPKTGQNLGACKGALFLPSALRQCWLLNQSQFPIIHIFTTWIMQSVCKLLRRFHAIYIFSP